MEGTATTVETIVTGATTALTTLQGNAFTMLNSVIPIAIAIMGAYLVVRIGIRAFKAISKG